MKATLNQSAAIYFDSKLVNLVRWDSLTENDTIKIKVGNKTHIVNINELYN